MLRIYDETNPRRIALHYNFCFLQEMFFDEFQSAASSHTLSIGRKRRGISLLIRFNPQTQNSGAS